jgi:hypothetical protein
MKLFTMKNWNLQVEEEAWGISAFKNLLDRDKSKEKQTAMKEMLYVYLFCDVKSDFTIVPEESRGAEIQREINLPDGWEHDEAIDDAIRVYKEYSQTTIQRLYQQSLKSAQDIGNYLELTDELLNERDDRGKPVTDISKITASLQRIPKLMADLKAAYKEVIKEQDDLDGKKKGSRTMNTLEDGIRID